MGRESQNNSSVHELVAVALAAGMGRPVSAGGLRMVVVLALLGFGLDLGRGLPQAPIRVASELKSGLELGLVA